MDNRERALREGGDVWVRCKVSHLQSEPLSEQSYIEVEYRGFGFFAERSDVEARAAIEGEPRPLDYLHAGKKLSEYLKAVHKIDIHPSKLADLFERELEGRAERVLEAAPKEKGTV